MDALRIVCLPQGLWIIIPFYQQEKLFSTLTACIQLCFFIHLLPHPHHPFLSCVIPSSPGSCLWFKVFSRCIAGRGETGRNNCSSLQLLPLQHLPFAFSLPIPRCCGAGLAAWGIQLLQCICAKLWRGTCWCFLLSSSCVLPKEAALSLGAFLSSTWNHSPKCGQAPCDGFQGKASLNQH